MERRCPHLLFVGVLMQEAVAAPSSVLRISVALHANLLRWVLEASAHFLCEGGTMLPEVSKRLAEET